MKRVHPLGIDPPYVSTNPMRTGFNFTTSPAGCDATPVKFSPKSDASLSRIGFVDGRAATYIVLEPIHMTFSPAFSKRFTAMNESFVAWLNVYPAALAAPPTVPAGGFAYPLIFSNG